MKHLLTLLIFVLLTTQLFSQGVTTASVSGKVTDPDGNPLISVTVKVVDTRTGSQTGAFTNRLGVYNVVGLRPGGPYKITASIVGYGKNQKTGVNLSLEENAQIDFVLEEGKVTTQELTVIGESNSIINSNRTGASQYVSEEEIMNLPTVERSIHDFSRLSPMIVSSTSGGSSVGGRNAKFNNIQIDGALMNDDFGLDASGTPGGQAESEPISLDAIESFQVNIAPFDVRQGGFTGGLVNAVTRGGSNQFQSSFYYFGRNENFIGDGPNEEPWNEFDELELGGRVGGPILKDKLFFFVNGEIFRRNDPFIIGINDPLAEDNFAVPRSTLDELRDIAIEQYNYDPGSYEDYVRETDNTKLFLRFDYNINDDHRLTFRHNFVNADRGAGVSRNPFTLTFDGSEYLFNSMQNQTVAQLNSVFGNKAANELRMSFTSIGDERDLQSTRMFPQIEIRNLGEDENRDVNMGIGGFNQANQLDQTRFELTNNFNYFLGNHVLTAGVHTQVVEFNNLFIPNLYGSWVFDNITAFRNGEASQYTARFSNDPNNPMPRTEFSYVQLAAYIQDEWKVQPNLKLNYGIRIDTYQYPNNPSDNEQFAEVFADQGYNTSVVPNPVAFSPRIGFNWDIFGSNDSNPLSSGKSNRYKTQLRGGIGLFAGRTPGVWIANQYANTGVDFSIIDERTNVPEFNEEATFNAPTDFEFSEPLQEINITDPDFQMPQILRLNLAVDQELPYGFFGTIEFLYGQTVYDILYQNINLTRRVDENGNPVNAYDGRPLYNDRDIKVGDAFDRVLLMTNTTEGNQTNLSFQLQKPFGRGFDKNTSINLSYTWSDINDLNSGTSSTAISNWRFNEAIDPMNPQLTTSNFEITHRILANVSYSINLFDSKKWRTTFGVFYEGRSGAPFSMIYNTTQNALEWNIDANSDDEWSNDPIYYPENADDAIFVAYDQEFPVSYQGIYEANNYAEFEAFMSQFDGIDEYKGDIIPRNAFRQPWRNTLDLRITQDIPTFDGQNFQITLDIMNFLNFMNKDWGIQQFMPFGEYEPVTFYGYVTQDLINEMQVLPAEMRPLNLTQDDLGKPMLNYVPEGDVEAGDYNTKDAIWGTSNLFSRWQARLGIRYNF